MSYYERHRRIAMSMRNFTRNIWGGLFLEERLKSLGILTQSYKDIFLAVDHTSM